jgi:nitronate monooxygenase
MAPSQRFELERPVIQAPMAGVQGSALAVAVCNAGGLGSLPCAMLSLDAIETEVRAIRAQTDRPFNLNFFCHAAAKPDAARDAAWREALAPYYDELALDPASMPSLGGREAFDEGLAELVCDLAPPVVSFHFGLPATALLDRVRAAGSKIIASATTVTEARFLEARGVDAIIAQGSEAGGHRGMFLTDDVTTQIGTFALLPQVVAAVRVPVIAAGGIADARGVRAALALGAHAAQIGTAFLLCPEASTSALHRAALVSDAAQHTAITNLFTGRPARSIVTRLMRELGPLSGAAPAFPLAVSALLPLRAKAESSGSTDFSSLWAGQNVSGCKEMPAGELTEALAGEA